MSLDASVLRDAFRKAQLRWHPDKFLHQFGNHIDPSEADEVLNRVKLISQQINIEWHQMSHIAENQ